MGSIGIVSLSDSAKSKIDLLPNNNSSCKGAARRGGRPSVAGRWSSGPLVGELRSGEITDQGIEFSGGHAKTARGPCLGAVWLNSALVVSVVPGSTRCLQLSVSADLAQDRILRYGFPELVETRRLELLTSSLQRRCSTN